VHDDKKQYSKSQKYKERQTPNTDFVLLHDFLLSTKPPLRRQSVSERLAGRVAHERRGKVWSIWTRVAATEASFQRWWRWRMRSNQVRIISIDDWLILIWLHLDNYGKNRSATQRHNANIAQFNTLIVIIFTLLCHIIRISNYNSQLAFIRIQSCALPLNWMSHSDHAHICVICES